MSGAQGMQFLTLGWLTLELTDSMSQFGLVIFCFGIPNACFIAVGGVFADKINRVRLLKVGLFLAASVLFGLGVMTEVGMAGMWHIYICAGLLGTFQAFILPTRMAMVADLVPREDITNAVAMNLFITHGSRIIAPAAAGAIIGLFGSGAALFLNGGVFLTGILVLSVVPNLLQTTKEQDNILKIFTDGIRYAFAYPPVALIVLALGPTIAFFGVSYTQVLPAFAKEVLDVDATKAGFLLTGVAIGATLGHLGIAFLGDIKAKGQIMLAMCVVFMILLFAFSWSTWYWASWVLVLFIGMTSMSYVSLATTILQLSVPQKVQGRILSLWTLGAALINIGALPRGIIADVFNWQIAMCSGPVIAMGIILWLGLTRPSLRQVKV